MDKMSEYLTCKCGNDERKYGGRVSVDGTFTCEECHKLTLGESKLGSTGLK